MQYINKFKDKQTGEERLIRDASIVVNGETPATDELTKVKIRGVEYGLQDGTVEVNGSTEATETLKTLTVGDKTYYVGNDVFTLAFCDESMEIVDPVITATRIRENCFVSFDNAGGGDGSTNIKGKLSLPNCTFLGLRCFHGQPITDLYAPKLEHIDEDCFYHYDFSGINKLNLPSIIYIGPYAFYGTEIASPELVIDLGENLERISGFSFSFVSIKAVIIRAKSVPAINDKSFDIESDYPYIIYVPDESIELYKADTNVLANVGNDVDRIKPLSEYVQS